MAYLTPDKVSTLNGVTVNEYLLTKHNPNNIAMPSYDLPDPILGVTIHNTPWISVSSETTPAEQYTRATINDNMGEVRVHYYVDNKCSWQNLPLTLSGWHAADGDGDGNRKTIAIECIMGDEYDSVDKKSEDNCAKLAAYLLNKYNLGIDRLYTHNHWYPPKYCPAYILPHWNSFKKKVESYLKQLKDPQDNVLDKSGYKKGDKTIGSLALKELLSISKSLGIQTVSISDNNYEIDTNSVKAINELLKKWGYKENGIAGANFIRKITSEILKKTNKAERILDKSGYKKGDKTIGSLALKELIIIANQIGIHTKGLIECNEVGDGTINAINELLKIWGYKQNGIAGANFIKKIKANIVKLTSKSKSILDKSGYKEDDKTIGSLALKELIIIAKELKLHNFNITDKDYVINNGTINAINQLLYDWGYSKNSIAGSNFIRKIADEINIMI